jgi:hypothetical protein
MECTRGGPLERGIRAIRAFLPRDLIRHRVDGDQQVKKASSTFASIDQVSEFYIDSIASNQIRQAFGHTKTGL